MKFTEIRLPNKQKELLNCYFYLTAKLKALWVEYVSYIESPDSQQGSYFYIILFNEMDYLEGLRFRIEQKLPSQMATALREIDDYSDW